MTTGDLFDLAGYDIVAQARGCVNGDSLLVLNNNSTHFLVASQQVAYDPLPAYEGKGKFIESFEYGALNAEAAYHRALERMVAEAMGQ